MVRVMAVVLASFRYRWCVAGMLLGFLLVPSAVQSQVTEDQKLLPPSLKASARFGTAVALVDTEAGALALIGAARDTERGFNAGAVYAFRYDEATEKWIEEAKFWPEAVGEDSYAGFEVALSVDGDLAFVAGFEPEPNDQDFLGRVHIFRRVEGSWVEEATLAASDETPQNGFGCSVAVSADGSVIAVGACQADGTSFGTGAVYVFRRREVAWVEEAKLTTERPCFFNVFGHAVDISASGDRLMVGEKCGEGFDPSALHFFHRSGPLDGPNGGWEREALFDPAGGGAVALSAEGDLALAGLLYTPIVVVYELEGTGWEEVGTINANEGTSSFGRHSLSLKGDLVLIGDQAADVQNENEGAAFLFRRSTSGTWREEAKLVASDGALNDDLGLAVTLSERFALAGAPRAGEGLTGAAYAFDLARVVAEEPPATDSDALSLSAYPNPFVSALTLTYTVPREEYVRITIYDVLGREVAVLTDSWQASGEHRARFTAQHLPAGLYVVRLETGLQRVTRRVALLE